MKFWGMEHLLTYFSDPYDRGSEFTDPLAIEFNKENRRRNSCFYCDPQRSDQKVVKLPMK